MSRPRLLSVAPWVPSPTAPYAGHQFYRRYLCAMAERFEVRLLAPDTTANRAALASAEPYQVELSPPVRPHPLQAHLGRAGAELGALRLQGRGTPVPDLAAAGTGGPGPEVVELCWSETLPLVPAARRAFPAAYLAAVQHDLCSEVLQWRKLGDLRLRQRARDALAGRVIARQERTLLGRCDLVLTFRGSHGELLARRGVRTPVALLAPFLDPAPRRQPSAGTKDVLFVGAFNRRENRLGASWLLEEVWPSVLAKHPDARLVLAGHGPGPELEARAGPSVLVTGYVADLAPYYRAAHCAVAPIFAGGGLRFKVPQALGYGIPVVATPEALAGLEGRPEGCVAGSCEEPGSFASAINWALSNPADAGEAARAGKAWVAERFSFDRSVDEVRRRYLEAAARRRR